MVEKFEVGHWYRLAEGVTERTMAYGWADQMSPLLDRKPHQCLWVMDTDETDVVLSGIDSGNYKKSWNYAFVDFDEVPAPEDTEHTCSSKFPQEDNPVDGDKNKNIVVLSTKERISMLCDAMKDLLIYKNEHYGDSALHPAGVFYKGDAATSIYIRMDDKLNRIKNNPDTPKVNDLADLIGYGFLALAKRMETEDVISAITAEKD